MAGKIRRKKATSPKSSGDSPGGGQPGAQASILSAGADTALRLLQDIRQHRIDPRDLSPNQRRSCLMLLANGSQTSTELAAMFRTSPSTIRMDLKKVREEVGREVREWTTSEVVGQLALMAEKTTAAAMKQEDPGLAWTIQRDLAKLLKELGVVRPEVDRSGFRMTVEAIGDGYERAREALQLALNPVLTGQQVTVPRPVDGLLLTHESPGDSGTLDAEFAVPQVESPEESPEDDEDDELETLLEESREEDDLPPPSPLRGRLTGMS